MSKEDADATSPQAVAAAQVAAIRDALYVIGHAATLEEVVQYACLPAEVVKRRLNAAGPGCFRPEWQVFGYDGEKKLWHLTALGRRAAEAAKG